MPGLGTIANVAGIVIGGILGLAFGKRFTESLQNSLIIVVGIVSVFIGIGGTLTKMLVITDTGALETTGSMMMIFSLVIGTTVGELLRLEDKMEGFGEWLKIKSGNAKDKAFVNAFVTASLTVCIGAMAVVGSIQDSLVGDHTILFAKAIMDAVLITMMAASMGKGAIYSAVSVGIFQGMITLLAGIIRPIFTEAALSNISYVGNIMIFCVGINIVFGKKVKVANMLPSLIVAVIWAFTPLQ